MKCRKFEDDSCTTIAACSQDISKLKAKALTLAKNIEDLKNAKAKVDSASSGRKGPGLAKPGHKRVTLDCTLLATKMAEISKAESGSDDLSTKASELATATIECTDKTVLTSISKELEEKSDE